LVTGVQTCALPILPRGDGGPRPQEPPLPRRRVRVGTNLARQRARGDAAAASRARPRAGEPLRAGHHDAAEADREARLGAQAARGQRADPTTTITLIPTRKR